MRIAHILTILFCVAASCLGKPGVKILSSGERNPASIDGSITVWKEIYNAPRPIVIHFLKVDLADPEIEVFVQLSSDPDGPDGPAEGVLTLPETLMEDPAILALINANAFSKVPSIPDPAGKRGWFLGRSVDIQGLAAMDGEVRSPDQANRFPFWMDEQGKPHLGHPDPDDKVRHAVADWISPLLIDGQIVGGGSPDDNSALDEADRQDTTIDLSIHPRSMLGFDDSGEWLLLAVVDGRQKGYSIGMTLAEQAKLMKTKGCTQAINVDGGGSSIMIVRDESGELVTINRPSGLSHRPVPVMLGVRLRAGNNAPAQKKGSASPATKPVM